MADLITRNDYKAYRGLASTNDDARIDVLLPIISQIVRTYCGRSFIDYYATNKVEYFSFTWYQPAIFLTEIPIVSIVSVEELADESQTTYDTLVSGTDFVVDTTYDAIYRVEGARKINWPTGVNAVKVTYKGGYAAVPADLKIACFDMLTYYMKEQYLPEKNHASFTIRNPAAEADFPGHIKRILDMYRDV